ncbi:Sulfite reductase [NADPH] subunit beta [Mucor velutinosus]|uniref:Sulfite reductase [NADPH] subunit beta n=1 Tax=Mucor velutinosus TaxID=708070 RepID=A0AAN7I0J1_9FUNG|nr:Sulfite reductase [NADPH] subunit beta [Mucor velutinosus]
MKFTLHLSVLAAAVTLISMVSAAPGQKPCHALSEAHANAVCKEYCGSTGYILGECGSEGICICNNKTTTVKVHHTTPHTSHSLTPGASASKVSTTYHHSTQKYTSKIRSSAFKKHSKSISTISHTRTNSKRHRSTKTTTTYKTVNTTITKTITMKASEVSALADHASSKSKRRVATVYTTVPRRRHD